MAKEKKKCYRLLWISSFSLVLFLLILLDFYKNSFLYPLDLIVNGFISSIQNNVFTSISIVIGYVFDTIPVIILLLIVAAYLLFKGYKKESLFVAVLAVLSGVSILLLKNVIEKLRPANSLISETGFAFPSGHAASSVILFGIISYLVWKHFKSKAVRIITICISVFMIGLIGFSRVYLNVHWFSDILAGYCLGAFLLFLCIYLFVLMAKKRRVLNNYLPT